jgi:mono/diheme cytochrome c family protein
MLFAGASMAADPAPLAIFRDNCAVCHGDNGEGSVGPALKPLPVPAKDARMTVRQGSGQMPPFSPKDLPDAALDALITLLEKWQ